MRYPVEHKEKTRERILDAAGRMFRRHGYEGVGIDRIMAEAGLTRGGFYGYFRSKEELFARVMSRDHDFIERLKARPGADPEELRQSGLEVVAAYLAPENRERVALGCSLSALSADTARSSGGAQHGFAAAVRELAAELGRGLEDPEPDDPRMLRSVVLCVGGLMLARAVDDPELADRISAACREGVAAELGSSPSP